MINIQVKRVIDNLIDIQCYDLSHNEYGSEQKYWIYSDQCRSKEQAIKNIDNWVKNINSYAEMLKMQVEELDK